MTNNKQKTAVEWLNEQLQNNVHHTIRIPLDIIQQAKEMEKNQMIESILDNRNITSQVTYRDAEQYYNERYKEEN